MMKTIEGYTYRVNQHIGKGYSSTVHKGLNDKTGEQVSIKVIQMAKLQDPINQMLLQLEVSALKTLANSKHVLHLYDVYATRNNTYLITELCEGDLGALLKQRKTIPYFEAVQIMRHLVSGYYDIHKAGYIHRDIKPANIFYKNGLYKIGDFGFTIPIAEINNHKNYNVGSPVYMPPQALKENIYSISCDVWAIGVIFYQLIKGVVPWRAVTQQVLYEKIMSEHIDSLTIGLPDVARNFFSQVLCLDPKLRISPNALLNWPGQLQSAPLDFRSFSPCDQRGRGNQVLRQINPNLINTQPSQAGIYFAQHQIVSPSHNENKVINFVCPKDQNLNHMISKQDIKTEDFQYKQAYFFGNNFINFIKFIHRVLKFISSPTTFQIKSLEKSITKYLVIELETLKMILENRNGDDLKIEKWGEFLNSPKGLTIKKKCKKYEMKYKMFHMLFDDAKDLNDKALFEGIHAIMSYLQKEQNFNTKLVIGADYLTTLYQLLHLRQKYSQKQFMRISKIDLIMQGNPYNASTDHLQKLKKKLLLISP